MWQARQVSDFLNRHSIPNRRVPIKSEGDLDLDVPLYEMGITGIFTRALDLALIRNEVDIAVHSMKDVPTLLPRGLNVFAVLAREDPADLAVRKSSDPLSERATVATGSLRRKAQWLRRYPGHRVVDLRGNVQTRLSKLNTENWQGALFASAGLSRMEIDPPYSERLDWMIPAPAQGAIAVVGRAEDQEKYRAVYSSLNHRESQICVELERAFLRELEGGCTAPIGALAQRDGEEIFFRAGLYSEDGKQAVEIDRRIPLTQCSTQRAREWAQEVLECGGSEIMQGLSR